MEQYLAMKKALLSGKEHLIQRASQATNPKVAKAILHSLRDDHASEWDQQVEETTVARLRVKFSQNKLLLSFLKGKKQLPKRRKHHPRKRSKQVRKQFTSLSGPHQKTLWNPTKNSI